MDGAGVVTGQGVVAKGDPRGIDLPVGPNPEVHPRAGRRRFTAAYQQRIVTEV